MCADSQGKRERLADRRLARDIFALEAPSEFSGDAGLCGELFPDLGGCGVFTAARGEELAGLTKSTTADADNERRYLPDPAIKLRYRHFKMRRRPKKSKLAAPNTP